MIHDQLWTDLSVRFGNDEQKIRAVWKMKNSYRKIKDEKDRKKIKLIDLNDLPARTQADSKRRAAALTMTCQAITLSGRPCKFKATCGTFCKKHKI